MGCAGRYDEKRADMLSAYWVPDTRQKASHVFYFFLSLIPHEGAGSSGEANGNK